MIDRWLVRVAVAELLVIALLSVWLWSAKREPPEVKQATREYAEARVVYDTVKVRAAESRRTYREAREVLTVTDTIEVERVLTLADSAIAAGERSEAAADTALARADSLISALRRGTKSRRIQPFAEVLYSPYGRQYVGRLGIGANITSRLSLIVAGEARRDGPQAYVGARIVF